MGLSERVEAACKVTEAKGTNLTFGQLLFQGLPCAALSGAHDSVRSIGADLSDAKNYAKEVLAGHISKKDAAIAVSGLAVVGAMAIAGKGQSPSATNALVQELFAGDEAAFNASLESKILEFISSTRGKWDVVNKIPVSTMMGWLRTHIVGMSSGESGGASYTEQWSAEFNTELQAAQRMFATLKNSK